MPPPPPTPALYYSPAGPYMPHVRHNPFIVGALSCACLHQPHPGHAPMYNYGPSYPASYLDEQYDRPINIISTNSHTSMENHSFFAPPPPAGQESEGGGYLLEMGALELKTKHLSLDSAYTSEADLDSSHNTTATNSGTVSPKDPEVSEKVLNGHNATRLNEEQLISTFSESAGTGVVKSPLPTIPVISSAVQPS